MQFKVLKPVFFPTGQTTETAGGTISWMRVNWRCLGTAESMEEARERFGGRPVLEAIGASPQHEIADRQREHA